MDKVQKIREEVKRLKSLVGNNSFLSDYEKGFNDGREDICDTLIFFIDSLKEEPKFKTGDRIKPVDSCLGSPRTIVDICNSWYVTDQGTLDFEYEDNWEAVEEPVSEGLGEYISELSKQFPEVSFAKLSRIAVRVAKWQKQQDQSTIELAEDHAYFAGRTKTIGEINEALLSEVLPCFMHGGEADEVVAKLDEVLNQKK